MSDDGTSMDVENEDVSTIADSTWHPGSAHTEADTVDDADPASSEWKNKKEKEEEAQLTSLLRLVKDPPARVKFVEPILAPNPNRFVMYPVQYPDLWHMYEKARDDYWTAGEIDLSKDRIEWTTKLTNDERKFVSLILAFFAASDGIVNENLASRFMNEVQLAEARAFYGIQIAIETIHAETYSLLIDTLISEAVEKDRLFNAIHHYPCIAAKSNWAQKWITSQSAFAARLIAFACVEGIFFSGAFCSIFWLKHRSLMPGLCFSNTKISTDEALHCEFAILLYSHLQNKLPEARVYKIVREAVDIELEFICQAIPCQLVSMSAEHMSQYIRFCANRLLVQLGYAPMYQGAEAKNPFAFMNMINLDGKSNMFEARVAEYKQVAQTGVRSLDFQNSTLDF